MNNYVPEGALIREVMPGFECSVNKLACCAVRERRVCEA